MKADATVENRLRVKTRPSLGDMREAPRRAALPHRFVLDALATLEPVTRAMFGALAVYVGERIVFILREHAGDLAPNGVWVAVLPAHEASLRAEFPGAGRVRVRGKEIAGWLLLRSSDADFEEAALRACDLVLRGDMRVGKVPGRKR